MMSPKRQAAYDRWQKAVRADMNRIMRNAPETVADMKKRHARITQLHAAFMELTDEEAKARREQP